MKKDYDKYSNAAIDAEWLKYEHFMAEVVLADVNQDIVQFQNDLGVCYDALHGADRLMLNSPDDECFAYSYLVRKKNIEQNSINELNDLIMKREFVARVIRFYISHITKKD